MGKVYYNQADSRWASHPYTAPGYENATCKTSGCGPTCAAMVVSSCKEIIYPNQMCDISKENGYRVPGGTSDNLYQYVANRWGIEMKRVYSSYEAHQACKEGYFVVIACAAGLWTTGGHFILAVGANDNEIEIYDPYLYNGKFNISGRQGKVRLEGNSAWVQIDTFKAYSNAQRFFAFKIDGDVPVSDNTKIMYVNTQSANLNVRNNHDINATVIGSLQKGTQVIVYEENNGWSRIGYNKWVSSFYLSSTKPNTATSKTMYVNTNSANLNIRNSAGGSIIGSLAKGTQVVVVGTDGDWSHITSPQEGWVSSQYLASSTQTSNTVGQTKKFISATKIWSNPDLTGTRYDYKANTSVKILQNVSSSVDKVKVIQTGREGYVSTSAYGSSSSSSIVSTVGQTKRFKNATIVYQNSNLTGTRYNYLANTSVKILQNVSASIDKISVIQTGRIGYVKTDVYK